MTLPFFFSKDISQAGGSITLEADASRHIAQVLRMQSGDRLQLTDGKGNLVLAELTDNHKNHCQVRILQSLPVPERSRRLVMAVSLLKQPARYEWFLEKATEIGVDEIIPLICSRTEKQHFKEDRWQGILISAMLQSRQARLPVLSSPVSFTALMESKGLPNRFIGYCGDEVEKKSLDKPAVGDSLMLIGPEGDFTEDEIRLALSKGYQPVTLGLNRLRTETAAMLSCVLLNQ
jgi:16S rRNA (uracil1498-N3)-methyltransferase